MPLPLLKRLMGTVPACRPRLTETLRFNAGFILSSACSIPANAKAENVKALTEAVEEWGRY